MATTVEAKATEAAAMATTAARPWYRDRRRLIIAAASAVVAIAAVIWFVAASAQRKEAFAARSLSQARAAAEAGNLPLASSELQKLIQTYRGTEAANEAVITLNQIRMINGQSELAAGNLREFLASKPEPKYAAPAYGLLGAALENAKRWADAGQAYTQASQATDVGHLKATYLVDAGRAYREGGRAQQAVQAYRTVLEKYPESPATTEAQVRLAELTDGTMGGALPEARRERRAGN